MSPRRTHEEIENIHWAADLLKRLNSGAENMQEATHAVHSVQKLVGRLKQQRQVLCRIMGPLVIVKH